MLTFCKGKIRIVKGLPCGGSKSIFTRVQNNALNKLGSEKAIIRGAKQILTALPGSPCHKNDIPVHGETQKWVICNGSLELISGPPCDCCIRLVDDRGLPVVRADATEDEVWAAITPKFSKCSPSNASNASSEDDDDDDVFSVSEEDEDEIDYCNDYCTQCDRRCPK